MITTPAKTIREAREGLDRLLPLLRDREHRRRAERVRDELLAIRGGADNGAMVPIDQVHIEEMQVIVGVVCLNGELGIEHFELASDLCTAMREIGLQAESVIG